MSTNTGRSALWPRPESAPVEARTWRVCEGMLLCLPRAKRAPEPLTTLQSDSFDGDY